MCEKCPAGTRKVGRTCVLLPTDDEENEEDEEKEEDEPPIVLPKPAPLYGESLIDLMHRLEDTGKKVQDPSYKAGRYMIFIYIYLIKKYASSCSIFNEPNTVARHAYSITYNVRSKKLDYYKDLAIQMRDCVLRGSDLIFITLYMVELSGGSHVNILIYRPFKKIVERYEPHGGETGWGGKVYSEYDINKQLKQLFEQTIQPVMKEYTPVFRTPYEICPRKGFQAIENMLPNNKKEQGYCQMWSMFMMETILLNPTLNTKDIIENCIEIGKNNPEYFKNLVRGYTQQVAREIKEYLSKVKYNIGSDEALREFHYMDIKELVDETLSETKKRSNPLLEVGEAPTALTIADTEVLEKEVNKLNGTEVEWYVQFIKYNLIITHSISNSDLIHKKQILLKLLLGRVLKWDTLMDNIYNSYFTRLSNITVKKIKYLLRYKHYDHVPDSIIRSLPNLSNAEKLEVLREVQSAYPLYHKFIVKLLAETDQPRPFNDVSKKKVVTDVAKLTQKKVAEYLYRIDNSFRPVSDDILHKFMSKTSHEYRVSALVEQLQYNNSHVLSIQKMLSI